MTVVRFPGCHAGPTELRDQLTRIDMLLAEYANRQVSLRDDGVRIRDSVRRMSALVRRMTSACDRLRRSSLRLESVARSFRHARPHP